jgi:hypothetical protein
MIFGNYKHSHIFRITILMLLVIASAVACTTDGKTGNKELDETEISIIVGKTLASEDLITAAAMETSTFSSLSVPATEAIDIQKTIDAQQATLDAQATLIIQPKLTAVENQTTLIPPTDTLIPTTLVSLEPIALLDWRPINMVQAPGCGEDKSGPPCWYGSKAEMSITSLKPIFIDPAWPSPHFIFSHRYVFVHDATIYVNVKGGWEILWSFPADQSAGWVPFDVDLTKFKGEEILIQMYSTGSVTTQSGKVRVSSWDIRDPQIIPDFSPY